MIFLLFFTHIDSLSLDQVIDRAFMNSPQYYESKASLDKSRTQFYQALSNFLPTLSVTAQYSKSEISGYGTNPYSGSLTLTQPLFDIDLISSVSMSSQQLKGSGFQHEADIAELMLNLKTAYYSLINANELMTSSEIAIKRAQENLDLIETKYHIGAASKLDKLQAEVFYLGALQDQAKAKTAQITAQEELKALLATDHEIFPTDSLMPPETSEFPSIDSLVGILKRANYNIQIAQELKNIAKTDFVLSYLAFLPKVSFFYGYNYSSHSLAFDLRNWQDNSVGNYGIQVSFPIFEIKSLIFNNLTARKELQQKEFSEKQIVLEMEKSLRTTYAALLEDYEQLEFAQKSLDAATEAAIIAQEQYALGTISFLDLLSAEEDAYETRVSYTAALSDFYIKRADLSYLLSNLAFQ